MTGLENALIRRIKVLEKQLGAVSSRLNLWADEFDEILKSASEEEKTIVDDWLSSIPEAFRLLAEANRDVIERREQ